MDLRRCIATTGSQIINQMKQRKVRCIIKTSYFNYVFPHPISLCLFFLPGNRRQEADMHKLPGGEMSMHAENVATSSILHNL